MFRVKLRAWNICDIILWSEVYRTEVLDQDAPTHMLSVESSGNVFLTCDFIRISTDIFSRGEPHLFSPNALPLFMFHNFFYVSCWYCCIEIFY